MFISFDGKCFFITSERFARRLRFFNCRERKKFFFLKFNLNFLNELDFLFRSSHHDLIRFRHERKLCNVMTNEYDFSPSRSGSRIDGPSVASSCSTKRLQQPPPISIVQKHRVAHRPPRETPIVQIPRHHHRIVKRQTRRRTRRAAALVASRRTSSIRRRWRVATIATTTTITIRRQTTTTAPATHQMLSTMG